MAYTLATYIEYRESSSADKYTYLGELSFEEDSMTLDLLGQGKTTPSMFEEKGLVSDACEYIQDEYESIKSEVRFASWLNLDELVSFKKTKISKGASSEVHVDSAITLLELLKDRGFEGRLVYFLVA